MIKSLDFIIVGKLSKKGTILVLFGTIKLLYCPHTIKKCSPIPSCGVKSLLVNHRKLCNISTKDKIFGVNILTLFSILFL